MEQISWVIVEVLVVSIVAQVPVVSVVLQVPVGSACHAPGPRALHVS